GRRIRPARRALLARRVPRGPRLRGQDDQGDVPGHAGGGRGRARRHGHHGDPRGGRPGRIRPVLRLHLRRGATPRTLETAAAGKDLFLLPQAAPLEACGAKPGHTSDADLAALQWDHLDLARRHPRAVGPMTFGSGWRAPRRPSCRARSTLTSGAPGRSSAGGQAVTRAPRRVTSSGGSTRPLGPSGRREERAMRRQTLLLRFEPRTTPPAGDPPSFDVTSGPGTIDTLDGAGAWVPAEAAYETHVTMTGERDRKSTRLNSSHVKISYAVF